MRMITKKTGQSKIPGKSRFQIDCLPFIFSFEELEILEKNGHALKALSEGHRSPGSGEERSFVECINGHKEASSTMETAWIKYLNRRKLESSLLPTEEIYKEYIQNHRH